MDQQEGGVVWCGVVVGWCGNHYGLCLGFIWCEDRGDDDFHVILIILKKNSDDDYDDYHYYYIIIIYIKISFIFSYLMIIKTTTLDTYPPSTTFHNTTPPSTTFRHPSPPSTTFHHTTGALQPPAELGRVARQHVHAPRQRLRAKARHFEAARSHQGDLPCLTYFFYLLVLDLFV